MNVLKILTHAEVFQKVYITQQLFSKSLFTKLPRLIHAHDSQLINSFKLKRSILHPFLKVVSTTTFLLVSFVSLT